MRLLISIPKEFEQHWQADKFEDSLHRLSADAHLLAGNYEQETAVMLIEAFKTAVPVPPHGRLINADALQPDTEWDSYYDKYRSYSQMQIDTAPTIEESRTGRWILNDNGTWSCNKCHSWIPDEQHCYAEYCLFCGAKMEVDYE